MEKSMRGPVAVGGTRSPVSLRRRATSPRKPRGLIARMLTLRILASPDSKHYSGQTPR